ncbi:MAG: hypothetical protein ACI9G1_003558, partial [Pirellulaceae bacterium]
QLGPRQTKSQPPASYLSKNVVEFTEKCRNNRDLFAFNISGDFHRLDKVFGTPLQQDQRGVGRGARTDLVYSAITAMPSLKRRIGRGNWRKSPVDQAVNWNFRSRATTTTQRVPRPPFIAPSPKNTRNRWPKRIPGPFATHKSIISTAKRRRSRTFVNPIVSDSMAQSDGRSLQILGRALALPVRYLYRRWGRQMAAGWNRTPTTFFYVTYSLELISACKLALSVFHIRSSCFALAICSTAGKGRFAFLFRTQFRFLTYLTKNL